jgi:preprotein translocase subunit YajC
MHQFQRKDTPVLGNLILASSSKASPLILAAAAKKTSSNDTFLLVIVVLVVLFYFVLIRPQSRKRRQVMEQQRQVEPGQRVRTTAGMYATVVAVEGDDVILEVAPGVQSRFVRRAIMEVLPDDSPEGTGYAGEPFSDEEAPETEDAAAAEPEDADHDAPEHDDADVSAHHGEESQNGSAPTAQDETRATDSV